MERAGAVVAILISLEGGWSQLVAKYFRCFQDFQDYRESQIMYVIVDTDQNVSGFWLWPRGHLLVR